MRVRLDPPRPRRAFTVEQLPEGVPIKLDGFVRAGGTVSGGTLHSAVHACPGCARRRRSRAAQAAEAPSGGPHDPRLKARPPPRAAGSAGSLPMPTIDPQVVKRSAARLERYGPDFTYGHYVATKHCPRPSVSPAASAPVSPRRRCRRPASCCSARGPRRRALTRAARAELVQGALRRRGRRAARGHRGHAAATRATARPRRCSPSPRCASPTTTCRDRRPGHDRRGDGPALIARLGAPASGSPWCPDEAVA